MKKLIMEKLVFGGQCLGFLDGKACFVWNVLPGEEVELEITKNKKTHLEAIATKIIQPSLDRIEPKEDHFLSCSPWQIMSFEAENRWKKEIAIETYKKLGGIDWTCEKIERLKDQKIASDGVEYGYRNKMEYSFVELGGKISLGFHIRESRRYIPITVCELARKEINEVALELLGWVNENNIPIRSLKTMIVRCNQKGEAIAGLFLKDRLQFESARHTAGGPELKNNLVGLTIFYSTHKSPASVPTDILYQAGRDYLEEDLLGTKLKYGLFSFFQINVPVFLSALKDIGDNLLSNQSAVDFYSGVGSISLPLASRFKDCVLVDNNEEAIGWARENATARETRDLSLALPCEQGREHEIAVCMPAEKMTELITSDKVVIVDPPRVGLDKRVVERILAIKPKQVIYLSCNLSTHARDIGMLKEVYDIKFMKLYNFFPHTAHIESLAVLIGR